MATVPVIDAPAVPRGFLIQRRLTLEVLQRLGPQAVERSPERGRSRARTNRRS